MLFFGDLPRARVVTVGLNPSRQEYLDRSGRELTGTMRRFETLASLGAVARDSLSDDQADQAIETMRSYFQPGKPVYSWFAHLNRVLGAFGTPYETGLSAHLDLVQEATDPTWSPLSTIRPAEADALLRADLPFLRWEIAAFPVSLVICNGRSVLDQVVGLLGARQVRSGKAGRLTWSINKARLADRSVGVAGWNIPLVRPTGLGMTGEVELGATIAAEARSLSIGF